MSLQRSLFTLLLCLGLSSQVSALSLAPEEFTASRAMACVLAEQSLGQLSEDEYGARTHTVLDGFDEQERNNILAKALGYVDGLMFAVQQDDPGQVNTRLADFIASPTCDHGGFVEATIRI